MVAGRVPACWCGCCDRMHACVAHCDRVRSVVRFMRRTQSIARRRESPRASGPSPPPLHPPFSDIHVHSIRTDRIAAVYTRPSHSSISRACLPAHPPLTPPTASPLLQPPLSLPCRWPRCFSLHPSPPPRPPPPSLHTHTHTRIRIRTHRLATIR